MTWDAFSVSKVVFVAWQKMGNLLLFSFFSGNIYVNAGDNGEVTTAHLLLGVWSQEESPGHKILVAFGFNDEKAKELKSAISEPGFVDD